MEYNAVTGRLVPDVLKETDSFIFESPDKTYRHVPLYAIHTLRIPKSTLELNLSPPG
jgi:hypothetical protein